MEWEKCENGKSFKSNRQDDPLSSYFFIFCIERLSHMILDCIQADTWRQISISKGGLLLFFSLRFLWIRWRLSNVALILFALGRYKKLALRSQVFSTNVPSALVDQIFCFGEYSYFPRYESISWCPYSTWSVGITTGHYWEGWSTPRPHLNFNRVRIPIPIE